MTRWLCALGAAVLAGCASGPSDPRGVESGTIVGEVGDPRNRARVHTELAALYYGRGNMPVALEELRIAVDADPGYATAHAMFALVHMELKEN